MLNSPKSIKCSVCGRMQTAITDHQSGEVICSSCGTVISEQNLDLANPEWRAFTVEEREDKAGLDLLSLCHDLIWALQQLLGNLILMLLERNWTLILLQYTRDYGCGILGCRVVP